MKKRFKLGLKIETPATSRPYHYYFIPTSLFMSFLVFLLHFLYFRDLFAVLFALIIFLAGWIQLYISSRKYVFFRYSYIMHRYLFAGLSKKKTVKVYYVYIGIRFSIMVLLTYISLLFRVPPFLMVIIFFIITEVMDVSWDSAILRNLEKENRHRYVFLDDLCDGTGRLIFYSQYFVLWMNLLNLLQLSLLFIILVVGFKARWIKLFGTNVNFGAIVWFSPWTGFFTLGLGLYWVIYIGLYSHYFTGKEL